MKCSEANKLINAYLDQQLDAENSLKLEQHLSSCPNCKQNYLELVTLQSKIKDNMNYYSTPAHLKQSILANINDNDLSTANSEDGVPSHALSIKSRTVKRTLAFAASILIGFTLAFMFIQQHNDEQLIAEVLSGHIRAITAKRYTDISSSKTETIIPWFTSRLNFSPKIFSFTEQGYDLAGGRLDLFHDQAIATVTYKVKNKLINVYTWPSPDIDDAEQESHHKQGYHLLYWCQNNMNYWIVSDSNNEEVTKLATLIRKQLDQTTKAD